ncbi:regulator of chromosome condensation 1/beta-lactamase-inhibitor protein II [Podospora didyma]|uniref:Regulator of chromosome condensation 1/beta-lactamase-inhibitor protein II n=1 Tax=Podospora didyma TaxID=330526 RepID=A0AAE0N5W2_9PEZI|nr:regulator of chromosome condensation 1/beta-lactamase-inhibitor protein II [Podospora didyma]
MPPSKKSARGSKRHHEDGLPDLATLVDHAKRLKISGPPPSPLTFILKHTRPMKIYVCGGNSGGELGLGPAVKSGNVTRPVLNPLLSDAGVVHISTGGMHGAALTKDNKILTWGVNDSGALGRDVTWDGGMVDEKDNEDRNSDSASDDGADLNPNESTPTEVDITSVAGNAIFAQLATTDNATFALTNTGLVYGWGTFRSNEGEQAFSSTVEIQRRPVLIPALKGVVKIRCGGNHVVALTADGTVSTWGRGTEGQLGRRFSKRIVDWTKEGLVPRKVAALKNICNISTGANHSFAMDRDGHVWSWGLNNAGQTGIDDSLGEFGGFVTIPTLVTSLRGHDIAQLEAGSFHSLAVTEDGKCLAWGRLYSFATGLKIDSLPADSIINDYAGRPSILKTPTPVEGLQNVSCVAAASEHSLAVTKEHKVYTWGLNLSGQLGQKGEEIKVATLLDRIAIKGKPIVWAGAGGQYTMLGEAAEPNHDPKNDAYGISRLSEDLDELL